MILVDLFPGARQNDWPGLEAACEYIEAQGDKPFSAPQLARAAGYTHAIHALRSLLALDLIQRISPRGARPVLYEIRREPHPVNPSSPRPHTPSRPAPQPPKTPPSTPQPRPSR